MIASIIKELKNLTPYLHLQDPILYLYLWQYVAILLLFFGSRLVILLLLKILLHRFSKRKPFLLIIQKIQKIHSYTLALLLFIQFIPYLEFSSNNVLISNIILGLHLICAVSLVLLAYRIVDASFLYLTKSLLEDSRRNVYFLPFLRRLSKIIITVLSILLLPRFFIIYDISGLLGNLSLSIGLLTTAMAFALKDTIHNFIGGIVIAMEQLLQAGDWIVIDNVEGIVMRMDFRTTVIKTDSGSIVHVPNAVFTNKKFINHGHVSKEAFTIKLVSDDLSPASLDNFLKGFYDVVKQHPETIEEKCSVKLTSIEGKVFNLNFELAFKPITERQSIRYLYEILSQLKKLASDMTIKIQE